MLRSDADVALLRQRISEAARSACEAVHEEITNMSADAMNDCVEEARRNGMDDLRRAVQRARG